MSGNKKAIVNVTQNMLLSIKVNFTFLVTFILYIQISKLKTFLIDSHPEECSEHVLTISVNLNLDVFIKTILIKKKKSVVKR